MTMNGETAQSLINLSDEHNQWVQVLFVIHNDKWIDISSAARGASSVTPVGAPDQPEGYPEGSVYRFDPKFRRKNKRGELITMMRILDTHPGCDVTLRDSNFKETENRLGLVKFCCKQYRTPPTYPTKNLTMTILLKVTPYVKH